MDELGGRSRLQWFGTGLRQAAMGPMFLVAFSLISVGGLARDGGSSMGVAVASTLIVWAGPAQIVYFGSLAAHVPLAAIALAITLSSVRFLPMSLALLPVLRGKRTSFGSLLLAAHLVAMTVWAETMRRAPAIPREARMSFYFGFAFVCISATAISTALGYILVGELPAPLAAGLLFLTPVYFVATLVRNSRRPIDYLALIFGLGLTPISSALFGPNFDLLALGLCAGTSAWFIQRQLDHRRIKP